MTLEKLNEPKKYLSAGKDVYFVKRNDNNLALEYNEAMYSVFGISSQHFYEHDFLSDDMTWGYARNILFRVMGYSYQSTITGDYDLVCSVESISI